jgi:hypothetical protein
LKNHVDFFGIIDTRGVSWLAESKYTVAVRCCLQ